jgi:hypothetical protein
METLIILFVNPDPKLQNYKSILNGKIPQLKNKKGRDFYYWR